MDEREGFEQVRSTLKSVADDIKQADDL